MIDRWRDKYRNSSGSRRSDEPFGGKPVVLLGDFHQTLLVLCRRTRLHVVDACIKKSPLWLHFKLQHPSINTRVADKSSWGNRETRMLVNWSVCRCGAELQRDRGLSLRIQVCAVLEPHVIALSFNTNQGSWRLVSV